MEVKTYGFLLIGLLLGVIGGYFIGSTLQNNDIVELTHQLDAKDEQIATLQTNVETLQSSLDKQIRFDAVHWNFSSNTVTVYIRNIGGLPVTLELISIRLNSDDSPFIPQEVSPPITLQSQEAEELVWDGLDTELTLEYATSYIIRVRYASDFYYEASMETPYPPNIQVVIEEVVWDANLDTATVTVKNTGGVDTVIESIGLQETTPFAPWYIDNSTDAVDWLDVGEISVLVWDGAEVGFDLLASTTYLIQVNCITTYAYAHLGETPAS